MKRKRVLLDCDGVLADFIGAALHLINCHLGTRHMPEDVTEFDFCKSLGLDKHDAATIKRMIGANPGFASRLAVISGSKRGVAMLSAIADVYIVTSPWNSNPTWTHDREEWLDRHFGIGHRNVVHASAKYLCAGDFLVDDKTSTCDLWQASHPAGVAVQWRTPHNRRDAWTGPSTCNWGDLLRIVTGSIPVLPAGEAVESGPVGRGDL